MATTATNLRRASRTAHVVHPKQRAAMRKAEADRLDAMMKEQKCP